MGQSGAKSNQKRQKRSSSTTRARQRSLATAARQTADQPLSGNGASRPAGGALAAPPEAAAAAETAPPATGERPTTPAATRMDGESARQAGGGARVSVLEETRAAEEDPAPAPRGERAGAALEEALDASAATDEEDEVVRAPLAGTGATSWRPDPARMSAALLGRGRALAQSAGGRLRGLTREQWLWIGIVGLAAVLRYWGMGDKPLHHDESMHAYYSLVFALDPSSYFYNPLLHGPFQFHAEGFMFAFLIALQHLFHVTVGQMGGPWINDTTARIVPCTFGVGIVALPYGLRRQLGRAGAPITAFLLAVSPAFVYFSRFLREDIYFNFFMFAMVVCAMRFLARRTTGWFVGIFLSAVLAYATFEGFYLTAAIFVGFLVLLAAWELASGLAHKLPQTLTARERTFFSRALVLLTLAAAAGTAALFGLRWISSLSATIAKADPTGTNPPAALTNLENVSVAVLLYASIVIALLVITVLVWQLSRDSAPVAYAVEGAPRAELVFDDDQPDPAPPRDFLTRVEQVALAPTRAILRLRARLDRTEQPFLLLLLSINWVQWFVAFVVTWMVFAALYWILPGPNNPGLTLGEGFAKGVGSGLWQGLYYWLDQQQVARGGQPFYYYLLLIPLYEQLAVVFGLAGLIYSLVRPTRFRLFLVWWFVASLGLYSWAGEKMPWLSIHILLPLFLLAGIALDWVARQCVTSVPALLGRRRGERGAELPADGGATAVALAERGDPLPADGALAEGPVDDGGGVGPTEQSGTEAGAGEAAEGGRGARRAGLPRSASVFTGAAGVAGAFSRALARPASTPNGAGSALPGAGAADAASPVRRARDDVQRRARRRGIAGLAGAVAAVVLLIPMVHSMWLLSRPDAAAGPLEMMVYVQTTNDVDLVMNKINHADQVLYGGQHKLSIGVGAGEEWPFYWYLRNYPTANYAYNPSGTGAPLDDVLILLPSDAQTFMALHPTGYTAKQYRLRAWFDESYKPLPCTPTKGHPCPASANWGYGVGLGNYLSYGSNPPANAHFDLGRAAVRLWAWLWVRQPLGATNGSYDFTFIVRNGLPIQP